ncbi:hypothetical protein NLY43_04295 [Mesorhizobium sp. C416B]|uniref:hypothetical protein n=1 Tax=unclassified Mesorhizobium TaxID=325217 RepID=UPI0003CE4362|nr:MULTISPECIES: hypothetical protein [unclassified Mesorhizobium]ESX47735.1 hypothetical protein X762_17925 [Mesorhizobium sp. LSHC426A00]ESX51758.1 hypothetical protein X761_24380 [Mesorhizobium sp. LSHC424B00]ESX69928.1 hypothetical protein X758_19045 [Mesorhizobium sp. LSHC416B00]ESX71843.1 hypothetical protein X757_22335 [Mesorhizobium sp. LSHC414A00]WJI63996.1 hypothetical protein NLY43_04295 [Mesorhizobium sp. C416B]
MKNLVFALLGLAAAIFIGGFVWASVSGVYQRSVSEKQAKQDEFDHIVLERTIRLCKQAGYDPAASFCQSARAACTKDGARFPDLC